MGRGRRWGRGLARLVLASWLLVLLAAACTPPAGTDSEASANTAVAAPATATLAAPAIDLKPLLPACDGQSVLEGPVDFVWPNVEGRLRELAGSAWGYYRCPGERADLSAFYQANLTRAPYGFSEVNWVTISQGTLGLYYHPQRDQWLYLWVVPAPADAAGAAGAYVIAALADALVFTPDCSRAPGGYPQG